MHIASQRRKFDVRLIESPLKVDDMVVMQEFKDGLYTGNCITVKVDYIQMGGSFGLATNYCVFGFTIIG